MGRVPAVGDTDERFCGSFKLFRPDGSFMPHERCPMAAVVAGTISEARDAEVIIERPDGSRVAVIVNASRSETNAAKSPARSIAFMISPRERRRRRTRQALSDRRIVGRCDHQQGSQRHHHQLECRCRTAVRLHCRGSGGATPDASHPTGASRRRTGDACTHPPGRGRRAR